MKKAKLDFSKFESSSAILKSIAHPLRIAILTLLTENKQLSVTHIHLKLDIEQAVASHHLAILKTSGAVSLKKDGKNVYYSLSNAKISALISAVDKIVKDK